jgi:hypothetical protein
MLHTLISGDDSRTDHPCKEWIMASVTRTAWRPFWPRLACCLVVGMGCCVPPLYLESAGQGHHGSHGTDRFFTSPDVRLLHVKVPATEINRLVPMLAGAAAIFDPDRAGQRAIGMPVHFLSSMWLNCAAAVCASYCRCRSRTRPTATEGARGRRAPTLFVFGDSNRQRQKQQQLGPRQTGNTSLVWSLELIFRFCLFCFMNWFWHSTRKQYSFPHWAI